MRKSKKSQMLLFPGEDENQETLTPPKGKNTSEDYFGEISNPMLAETDLPPPHANWANIIPFRHEI
jgi:hypothetical protein